MTTELALALDHSNVSDRRAVRILEASAIDRGQRPLSLNSVRCARIKEQSLTAATLRDTFMRDVDKKDASFVLHWDGKLLPDLTGKGENGKVECLPMLIPVRILYLRNFLPYQSCQRRPGDYATTMCHGTCDYPNHSRIAFRGPH